MGFIEEAVRYGYQAEEILKMIASHNPQFKEKVDEAVKYGYTPTSILRDMARFFKGTRGEKTAKVMGINPKWSRNLAFSEDLDPATVIPEQMQPDDAGRSFRDTLGNVAGAGAGAAIGFATGGPAGAVGGATAGSEMYQKLVDKYRQQGRSMSFGDFVKTLASAAAKGTATGFSAKFLMDVLKNLTSEPSEQVEGEVVQEEGVAPVTPTQEGAEQEVPPSMPEEKIEDVVGADSYEIFRERGIERIIDSFATQITPEQGRRGLRNLFGAQYVKDIERETKKPIEKVLSEAFEFAKQKGGGGGRSSFVDQAMEGIEFSSLPRPVQNRVRMINQQIERLEKKGVPYDSKRIQKLLKKRDKFIQGEGLNVAEEEEVRFEKAYGKSDEQTTMQPEQSEVFTEIFKSRIPETEEAGTLQKSVKPLDNSLKSSNVVGAFFDADTNKMRTVFRSGDMYEYDNISLDELEKVTGGKAKPITEGATQYGFWFPDKKKSVGAAFSKFIKKKADEFPYRKLEKSELRPNESQLRDAVRTFNTSGIFEPFKQFRKGAQQLEKGKILREMEPALKEVDDDFLQEMVAMIESELGLKTPIKMTRLQKEFRKEFL